MNNRYIGIAQHSLLPYTASFVAGSSAYSLKTLSPTIYRFGKLPIAIALFAFVLLSTLPLSAQIPTNGLVGHWPFNSNASDASGNGHHGTAYGGPTPVLDRFGNRNRAYNFDGNNDYIRIPHHENLNIANSFTISAWVKFCTSQVNPTDWGPPIFEKGDTGSLQGTTPVLSIYGLSIFEGDRISGNRSTGAGGFMGFPSPVGYADGNWHHIVYTVSQGTTSTWDTLYVDDVPVRTGSGGFYLSHTNTEDVYIGYSHFFNTWINRARYFKGAIDDIRLYNRPLSRTEVNALYTEGGWPATEGGFPTASVTANAVDEPGYCLGFPVPIHLLAEGEFDSIRWFPEDSLSNPYIANPIAMPRETTTYTAYAYKFGENFPCADTALAISRVTITIYQPPIANAGGAQYVCADDSVTLGGRTDGGKPPYSWQWSPTTGLSDPTVERPRLFVTKGEQYQVIVTDANGCRDTTVTNVSILPQPSVQISADTAYFCRGSNGVQLSAIPGNGNPPYRFNWSESNGLDRIDSSDVFASPDAVTTYFVEVNDVSGLCAGVDSVVVIPVDPPTARAGNDLAICDGETVRLDGSASGEANRLIFEWSPVDGLDDPTLAQPRATPTATTTYTLRVTDTLTQCFAEDQVTVEVRQIKPRLDIAAIDFGTLDGCKTDTVISLRIFNDGISTAQIDSSRSNRSEFVVLSGDPNIPAQSSTELRIRFAPRTAGTATGTLTIYIGPCNDSLVINLSGRKEQSSISTDLSSVDFGKALSCNAAQRDTTITITNQGNAEATINPALVAAPFSVVAPSLPATIPAGEELEITIRFDPTTGTFNDELRLPFSSGSCVDTMRVALNATVEEPRLDAEFSAIDFGLLDGCSAERDSSITITNPSSVDITIDRVNLPPDFLLNTPLPITIPAGSQLSLALRFLPATTGNSNGMAQLFFQPCDGQLSLDLAGRKQGVSFAMPTALDFGELIDCNGQTDSRTISIRLDNQGAGDGRVTNVAITGPFSTDLSAGTALSDGVAEEFTITFSPTAEGTFAGELILQLEPCGLERRIALNGEFARATLTATPLNFGIQPVGSAQNDVVVFENTAGATLHVERVDGVTPPFTIMSTTPPLPADIGPGEQLSVEIQYDPVSGQSVTPVIAVVTDPCTTTFETEVRGEGQNTASAEIILPDLAAAPGEQVLLELRLEEAIGLDAAEATRFRAEIAFDPSMLVVTDNTPWRIENDERVVELQGQRAQGNNLLARLALKATLGRMESTPLRIVSFEWIDANTNVPTQTTDGSFTLHGLCRDGGVRLYDPNGEIAIKSVSPNPSSGDVRIVYSLSESGEHRLRVVDLTGREVRTVFAGAFVPGEYAVQVGVGELSSGTYYLLLETPTTRVTKEMQVVQ